jgi:hypothetical protein
MVRTWRQKAQQVRNKSPMTDPQHGTFGKLNHGSLGRPVVAEPLFSEIIC